MIKIFNHITDCILIFIMGIACLILAIVGAIVAVPVIVLLFLVKGVLSCSEALVRETIRSADASNRGLELEAKSHENSKRKS